MTKGGLTRGLMVELVRLYSNLSVAPLDAVRCACSALRPNECSRCPRQHHRRLATAAVTELIQAYGHGASIKHLAQRFGIHRVTVSALLRKYGADLRRAGLAPEELSAAVRLYGQGWSCARLGERLALMPPRRGGR